MNNQNENKNKGGCLGIIFFVIILVFVFKSCNVDSSDEVSDVDMGTNTRENVESNLWGDNSKQYKIKFEETGKEFYDTYMNYFGENFSIDDEPFKYGKYKGKNREKYKHLEKILEDMCFYYENIEDKDDRYDALASLELKTYDYVRSVIQMIILLEDRRYDNKKFWIEYSDFIICAN